MCPPGIARTGSFTRSIAGDVGSISFIVEGLHNAAVVAGPMRSLVFWEVGTQARLNKKPIFTRHAGHH